MKLSLVEKALWDGIKKTPDNEVVLETNWVQQTTPGAPTTFLNGVYRCELSERGIEEKIRTTIEHYRKLKLPFRWKVTPSSRPANLKTLLLQEGLELKDTLFGLFAEPKELKIPTNPRTEVKELTLANLEDWLRVQELAWQVPPPGIAYLRHKTTETLKSKSDPYNNLIAYYDGEPVGSAGLRFFPDYAYLAGAAVNPSARKQGVYRTLLAHRMRMIEQRGVPAVIHCLENTSAPICLKLGFEKVCEIYSYEPKSSSLP